MQYPGGIHARLIISWAEGNEQAHEIALGPAESLGDLHNVVERFAEAYCLSVGADGFLVGELRLCLFDPSRLLVAFDEDDEGRPDADDAMNKRFAFAFLAQSSERYSTLDPWLVVRPCTRDQVKHWQTLMSLDSRYTVKTWCLDRKLTDRLSKS